MNMNLKELVVCKYDQHSPHIYTDPVILPCGNRSCREHVETMLLKNEENSTVRNESAFVKCRFCSKIHSLPDDGFPDDNHIPYLLSMKHSDRHEKAKLTFNFLSDNITKLLNISKDENTVYLNDYFNEIRLAIELERTKMRQRLDDYYDQMLGELADHETECTRNLEKSSFEVEKNSITEYKAEFDKWISVTNFDLMTCNGNDDKWAEIQAKCEKLNKQACVLKKEYERKLLADKLVRFKPSKSELVPRHVCGKLIDIEMDSSILNDRMRKDLASVCDINFDAYKLIYRASRDGFSARAFHDKCDNRSRTITIIKSKNGNVFGGYTSKAWDKSDSWKHDTAAYIFSLVNADKRPLMCVCRKSFNAIYCSSENGPSFGGDIMIANDSNQNKNSYSNLGDCFSFGKYKFGTNEAQSFLAGAFKFQTVEIETFEMSFSAASSSSSSSSSSK